MTLPLLIHWLRSCRRPVVWAPVLTLVLSVVCMAIVWTYVTTRAAAAQELLDSIAPRVARLEGLKESADDLRGAQRAWRDALAALNFRLDLTAPQASEQLLLRVRELAESTGLQVQAAQTRPAQLIDELEALEAQVTLRGGLGSLVVFFQRLEAQTPAIGIQAFSVQLLNPVEAFNASIDPSLQIEVTVRVYRVPT